MKRTFIIILVSVLIASFLIISAQHVDAQSDTLTFATLGDFGVNNEYEAAVASMVTTWNPDLILALGDNYYAETGGTGSETYDLAVGKYYCNFLKDIQTTGTACPAGQASVNRFFPALGDHDYTDAGTSPDSLPATYLNYFTLPGEGYTSASDNERYYDFVSGPVHFFIMNSLDQAGFEPDGTSSTSIQAQWLKTQLGASTSTWNVVVVHNPPYSSGTKHGSRVRMQWPFAEWGADVVFSGDEHSYERILRDGIVYFVNGLGGQWPYPLGTPIEGSAAHYNGSNGAQRVTVTNTSMTFEFYSYDRTLQDSYTITTPHNTATPSRLPMSNGWQSPGDQASVKSNAGDNNGYEVNPAYAFANDGMAATDLDSGTSPSFTCADSGMDKHKFSNYNFSIPDGVMIQGIQVQLDANADSTVGNPKTCVSLSWNGGTSWTAWKSTPVLTNSEASYFLGGAFDTWGRTWTAEELSSSTFHVRVANITSDNTTDFSLDWIGVRVVYTLNPTATPTTTPSYTPTASQTDTPVPTATQTGTSTALPTETSTATGVPTQTDAVTFTSTASPTAIPSETPTYEPTSTSSALETNTATATPTATFTEIVVSPSATPTSTPTTTTTPINGANVNVGIGVKDPQNHWINLGKGLLTSYSQINDGPVKITSTNSISVVGSEAITYKVNGVPVSFSEMMALPNSHLDTIYWLPWYNNVDLDTQLRFGNVSSSSATVRVYIGGQEMQGSPFELAAGASVRQSFAGVNNGPVKIVSSQNIVAAERVIYKVKGAAVSFSEMMGLPNSQLNTTYWLPWYNNVDLDSQLRLANVSTSIATVRIYIGGREVQGSPFVLTPAASTRLSFAGVNNGPVQIVSSVPIVAAERVIYKVNGQNTSFSETMALPDSQLSATYWLPWYNNVGMDSQLRFANVRSTNAIVHVFIAGQEMPGSPFTIAPGASLRQSFPGVNAGSVKLTSNVNIVAAERIIYKANNIPTSFSEMLALPGSQLSSSYWLPWYNNQDLNTELRLGVP